MGNPTNVSKPYRGPQVEVTGAGEELPALMDTGSNMNALCNKEVFELFKAKGCPVVESDHITVTLLDQTVMKIKQQVQVEIAIAGGKSKCLTWVTYLPGMKEPLILGYPLLKSLRLVWDLYHHRYWIALGDEEKIQARTLGKNAQYLAFGEINASDSSSNSDYLSQSEDDEVGVPGNKQIKTEFPFDSSMFSTLGKPKEEVDRRKMKRELRKRRKLIAELIASRFGSF